MNILEITLKLLLAVALGGLIGLERESSHKPAGFRTNILICIGAAMMMTLAQLIVHNLPVSGSEMTRVAAGVITGIGFIGAGTIIQSRGSVTGLTSAATLWSVTALGLVIGAGYFVVAIIFTGLIILTLVIFRHVELQYMKKSMFRYLIKTKNPKDLLAHIQKVAIHEGLKFHNLNLKKDGVISVIGFSIHVGEDKEQKFNEAVLNREDILEIKIE